MSDRRPCPFPGCANAAHGRDYCTSHRAQIDRGDPLAPIGLYVHRKRSGRVPVSHPVLPGAALVPLTRGKSAVIDEQDATAVAQHTWTLDPKRRTSYAATTWMAPDGSRTTIHLHRFLWALWKMPETPEIDHRNNDGLDCRRSNLRAATSAQNKANRRNISTNTSGHKGVFWDRRLGKWFSKIIVSGKRRHLGTFDSKEDAACAYAAAAADVHGEFARME